MPRLTLDLDPALLARLDREARLASRTRGEFVRDAIVECVESRDKERFIIAIARAASVDEGESPVALAEEALLTGNDAFATAERPKPRSHRGA